MSNDAKRALIIMVMTTMIGTGAVLVTGLWLLDEAEATLQRERDELFKERSTLIHERAELQRLKSTLDMTHSQEQDLAEMSVWAARHNAVEDAAFQRAMKSGGAKGKK